MNEPTPIPLAQIAARTRYPLKAFEFVRLGLEFTVHRIHSQPETLDEHERHVSGEQLSLGLRDYAIEKYGRLARHMLSHWNIHRTEDFGQIVFAMVNGNLMQASPGDSVHDFDNVFDFEGSFDVDVPVEDIPLEADPFNTVGNG